MNGYLGTIGDTVIQVSKKYKKEDGTYGFIINANADSENGKPEDEKFAICRCPEVDWYSKYGYSSEELNNILNYVIDKTNNGQLIDEE